MAKINEVHSVMVPVANANFTAHTYTEIYGGLTGCTLTINGTPSLAVGGSSSVFITVRSISGGAGCFLLGVNNDVSLGSPSVD